MQLHNKQHLPYLDCGSSILMGMVCLSATGAAKGLIRSGKFMLPCFASYVGAPLLGKLAMLLQTLNCSACICSSLHDSNKVTCRCTDLLECVIAPHPCTSIICKVARGSTANCSGKSMSNTCSLTCISSN